MSDIKKIAEDLVNLNVKEVNELTELLENEYGIKPAQMAAPVAVAQDSDAGGTAEKTSFDVVIKSAGAAKLKVVKLVKDLTGKGLKESKDIVDAGDAKLKEGISKDEAEKIKQQLEEVGAEVELV